MDRCRDTNVEFSCRYYIKENRWRGGALTLEDVGVSSKPVYDP